MSTAPVPTTVGDGLKAAFRTHPAGVAIITASTPAGPVGLTASSVASRSLSRISDWRMGSGAGRALIGAQPLPHQREPAKGRGIKSQNAP